MTHTTEQERANVLHALEESQSLLAAMLHEARPAVEIQKQMLQNRDAIEAAHRAPAVPVPQDVEKLLAELTEEIEATDNWRRLALQFDGHRMQAIGHLKAMLTDPKGSEANALEFIKAAPLNGEAVLAQRIAALAAAPQPPEADHIPDTGKMVAAPVELPEPVYTMRVRGRMHDYTPTLLAFDLADGEHELYTEQQVRDLLAANGIEVSQ